ncbi:MAG TPA: sigma-54-dependent Fis family transcriptional regulator [Anaeromyxobacteraceae bacterium]|nr:sigma-54-dependent Fis family transcriptional regulator [Anaeromyxobacteraceae bacterium]
MRMRNEASSKQERRQLSDGAWRRFVRDGVEPGALDPEIAQSWIRCRDRYAIDTGLSRPLRRLGETELAERRAGDDAFRALGPILRDFTTRIGTTDHVLAYFDADGVLLSVEGDPRIAERARAEIGFGPGASWAEDSAGTCGPGLALATGRAVEVIASEHFVEAFHAWSDAASPILVPGSAAPVGVIDITGPWEVHRRQALPLAKAIARAIEERIAAAASVRDEVVRHALRMAQEKGDALVAVDAQGRVIAANDAAARRSVVEARALAPKVREALATTRSWPTAGAEGELRLPLEGGGAVVLSVVRHAGAPVGAVLRVLASSEGPPRSRLRQATRYDLESILGRSAPIRRCVEQARSAAANELPVVLTGESGTGKELVAQAVHAASGRRGGPFVAVNCASIPAQLVEAELFGYEAGTFTGAVREGKPGRFEDASGGTLFLDELSELPLAAQAALLRVLQEREVVRLGSSTARPVDVRVVAATNKPLEPRVQSGQFRRDLYYRLDVLPIAVPSLRERGDDVVLLAESFLASAEAEVGRSGLTLALDAVEALRAHPWPGNVRELRNVILRAAATAPGTVLRAADLGLERSAPELAPAPSPEAPPAARPGQRPARKLGRGDLVEAIEACQGNFTRAARQLGVSRMTLYRWARKHAIPIRSEASEPATEPAPRGP